MATRPVQIVKNGNALVVTIPRPILHYLGWQPGEFLTPEILDDGRLCYRRPTTRDFAPTRVQPFLTPESPAVKP